MALSRLSTDLLTPSAFGYNEAQLRFHHGDAMIRLGQTEEASRALHGALALYPETDYMDRALAKLDLAACRIAAYDVRDAFEYAASAVLELDDSQRDNLILIRVRELLVSVPSRERRSVAARELREVWELSPASTVGMQ